MNHIAFVIPTVDRIGGAERQMLDLAHGLAQRAWRVSVVALTGTAGASGPALESANIHYTSLQMRKGLADPHGWLRMNQWLRQNQPDVLHAHLPHAAWMARWSRLLAPVRVVVDTVHTASTGTPGRKTGYAASRWLTDQTTAVSRNAATAWVKARMIAPKKLSILPNGIDTEAWKPNPATRAEMRTTLELKNEFLWIAAGRLEPVKDFPSLLRAISGLPAHAHLIIAGAGSMERELRATAHQLGIESRVRFLGFEPHLLHYLQAADAFVLSSLWEGLPMCLLEAGACALPSVSTAVSGATEILRDGQTGFLVPPRNTEALCMAMGSLMRMHADDRIAMGTQARQRVASLYSMSAVLDRWEELYTELLAWRPRPARAGFKRFGRQSAPWQTASSGHDANASST